MSWKSLVSYTGLGSYHIRLIMLYFTTGDISVELYTSMVLSIHAEI